ncbi:MAG: hypothetical protein KGN34_09180 [Sphingomonadales bacterium]|nr:hypothetical protein [Sphingomonadales bacterium]
MLHFEIIPAPVWFFLAVIVVAGLFIWLNSRRQKSQDLELRKQKRLRHIAHYKAWMWLKGKPKQLRIIDGRDKRDR